MIAARVAGVPSPVSFIASDSSLSSRLLPAVCIAVKSVPSVNRFGGRVFFFRASIFVTSWTCPSERVTGRICSGTSPSTLPFVSCLCPSAPMSRAFQPICSTTVPVVR